MMWTDIYLGKKIDSTVTYYTGNYIYEYIDYTISYTYTDIERYFIFVIQDFTRYFYNQMLYYLRPFKVIKGLFSYCRYNIKQLPKKRR